MAVATPGAAAVRFQVHADAGTWCAAVAGEIAANLRAALDERPRARMLVSGGGTPGLVYSALARVPLPWDRVDVGLVDERWLPPNHPDSNARVVYSTLLRDAAARARFEPLVRVGDDRDGAVAAANARPPAVVDVAVLGMGGDGHTASLFPGSIDLDAALAATSDYVALDATGCPGAGAFRERITATPSLLRRVRARILLVRGDDKRRVLERALAGDDPRELPVRVLFAPGPAPLSIHWCP